MRCCGHRRLPQRRRVAVSGCSSRRRFVQHCIAKCALHCVAPLITPLHFLGMARRPEAAAATAQADAEPADDAAADDLVADSTPLLPARAKLPARAALQPEVVLRAPRRALMIAAALLLSAAGLCLIVRRLWVRWLPPLARISLYFVLATALYFLFLFCALDLLGRALSAVAERWPARSAALGAHAHGGVRPASAQPEASPSPLQPLARRPRGAILVRFLADSPEQIAALSFVSCVSGLYFGFVFGLMEVPDDSLIDARLVLQREIIFAYPISACTGALSAVVNVLVRDSHRQGVTLLQRVRSWRQVRADEARTSNARSRLRSDEADQWTIA